MARILVIEDDRSILENTLEILEYEGFEVFGAGDGCEGLAQVQRRAPDIIICDILMPKLDGYGVLKALRADPTTRQIPLVFISAAPSEEILAATTKMGASDYLVKPFRASDLIRIVRTILHNGLSTESTP
ncbi:MAG: response regulator [Anaerolineae bacterium]|nr:response regulator [Anaerolineae bacterium]